MIDSVLTVRCDGAVLGLSDCRLTHITTEKSDPEKALRQVEQNNWERRKIGASTFHLCYLCKKITVSKS